MTSKKPRNRHPASGRRVSRKICHRRCESPPWIGRKVPHRISQKSAMQLGRKRARRSTETGGAAVTKSGNPQAAATQSTAGEDEVWAGEGSERRPEEVQGSWRGVSLLGLLSFDVFLFWIWNFSCTCFVFVKRGFFF